MITTILIFWKPDFEDRHLRATVDVDSAHLDANGSLKPESLAKLFDSYFAVARCGVQDVSYPLLYLADGVPYLTETWREVELGCEFPPRRPATLADGRVMEQCEWPKVPTLRIKL
jgi:hypothetical protein